MAAIARGAEGCLGRRFRCVLRFRHMILHQEKDVPQHPPAMGRRAILAGLAAAPAALATAAAETSPRKPKRPSSWAPFRLEPAQSSWTAEPEQVPATERMIDVGDGVRLWTWDTGGTGPAVVLMHAYTGSGATWAYQQPVFARAGYRVVGYSRRGHFRSDRGPEDRPGRVIDDLDAIVTQLGISRFHLVGTAAGGFNVTDYALSHPGKLISLTVASSLGGVDEPDFVATTDAILPPGWRQLPSAFRELGPSYRAANPEGVQRWVELEEHAMTGPRLLQGKANRITWDALRTVRTPAMMLTGDADLYFPPARLRAVAAHLPGCRTALIAEAGHAAFWEQPEAFNRLILDHLALSARAG